MAQPKKKRTPSCAKIAAELEAARKKVAKLEQKLEAALAAERQRAEAKAAKIRARHERDNARRRAQQERELKAAGVVCSAKPRKKTSKKRAKKGAKKAPDAEPVRKVRLPGVKALRSAWPEGKVVQIGQLSPGESFVAPEGPAEIATSRAVLGSDDQLVVFYVPREGAHRGERLMLGAKRSTQVVRIPTPPRPRGRKDNATGSLFAGGV